MKLKFIIIIFFLLSFAFIHAKQASIIARLDSTQIKIGEQTSLCLNITLNKKKKIKLPMFQDTLVKGLEILNISKLDTTNIGNNCIQIKYNYLITAFEAATYVIHPIRLIIENDTFYSKKLLLKVSTLKVDTITNKFYDIKNIFSPKFIFIDYINILFYILSLCILILVIHILTKKKKQKLNPFFKQEKKMILPHIHAIQSLNKIKEQKLWQQGKNKEYYSQISDIIRNYINERFYINAMEMTSELILQNLKNIPEVEVVFNNLKQLLLLADLVKFAKFHPLADENKISIANAYLFVKTTIPIDKKENS